MFKTDFIQKREDRGSIEQTCAYVEKGAHELVLLKLAAEYDGH